MEIGERLRRLRKERKLTLAVIEQKTGLSAPYLSRMENGYFVPSIKTLERLLSVLDVSTSEFFIGISQRVTQPLTGRASKSKLWGNLYNEKIMLRRFQTLFERMKPEQRELILAAAIRMQKK